MKIEWRRKLPEAGDMDPTEHAFLVTLDDFPRDDLTRAAYADFLEERGDPRAAFLRLQLSIRGHELDSQAWREDDPRLRELRRTLDAAWVARVEPLGLLGELSVRLSHILAFEGIRTIGDLVRRSEEEFLELRSFGETSFREARSKLASVGLRFREHTRRDAVP